MYYKSTRISKAQLLERSSAEDCESDQSRFSANCSVESYEKSQGQDMLKSNVRAERKRKINQCANGLRELHLYEYHIDHDLTWIDDCDEKQTTANGGDTKAKSVRNQPDNPHTMRPNRRILRKDRDYSKRNSKRIPIPSQNNTYKNDDPLDRALNEQERNKASQPIVDVGHRVVPTQFSSNSYTSSMANGIKLGTASILSHRNKTKHQNRQESNGDKSKHLGDKCQRSSEVNERVAHYRPDALNSLETTPEHYKKDPRGHCNQDSFAETTNEAFHVDDSHDSNLDLNNSNIADSLLVETLNICNEPISEGDIVRMNTPKNYNRASTFDSGDKKVSLNGMENLRLTKCPTVSSSNLPRNRRFGVNMSERFKKSDDINSSIYDDDSCRRKSEFKNISDGQRSYDENNHQTAITLRKSGMAPHIQNDDLLCVHHTRNSVNSTNLNDVVRHIKTTCTLPSLTTYKKYKDKNKTRRKAGSSEDNAITIDSDSEEDDTDKITSIYDDTKLDVYQSDRQTKKVRAVGDLVSIEAERIAVGEAVFRSKCMVKFQFGTKEPYILFVFSNGSETFDLQVKIENLKELKYFRTMDDVEGVYLDRSVYNMSIIAFQDRTEMFTDCNDQMCNRKSKKQYIVAEFRQKDDFDAMLKQISRHPSLQPFCEVAQLLSNQLSKYVSALIKDEKSDQEKNLFGPRTRSGGRKKMRRSENKLLLIYPFTFEEEVLRSYASELTDICANSLGVVEPIVMAAYNNVPETVIEVTDVNTSGSEEGKSSARAHYLTIMEEDRDRLQPSQFLNDTLIDFWMSWISREEMLNRSSSKVHFFTSHFMTTLYVDGVEAVASWTSKKKINIFDKNLVFLPINGNLHWSLCVVVNPGLIGKAYKIKQDLQNSVVDDEWPCLLFMDSLKMHKKQFLAKKVRGWLNYEWHRTMKNEEILVESPFNEKSMKLIAPKIPYQQNFCDCGVFVCRYAANLYTMRDQKFTVADIDDNFRKMISDGDLFQFGMDDIARMRNAFTHLLDTLSKVYYKAKQHDKDLKKIKSGNTETHNSSSVHDGVTSGEKENTPQDLSISHHSKYDKEIML